MLIIIVSRALDSNQWIISRARRSVSWRRRASRGGYISAYYVNKNHSHCKLIWHKVKVKIMQMKHRSWLLEGEELCATTATSCTAAAARATVTLICLFYPLSRQSPRACEEREYIITGEPNAAPRRLRLATPTTVTTRLLFKLSNNLR